MVVITLSNVENVIFVILSKLSLIGVIPGEFKSIAGQQKFQSR